jgi:O-antigen/teichoic acid export membrane protein
LHARGDKEGQDATFRAAQRFLVLIAAPLVAAMIALPTNGILVTLGPAYLESATPLRWLAGWALFMTLSQPVSTRLMAEGHNRVLVVAIALNAVSDIVLNVLFIPRWGPTGAAATTLVSALLGFAYLRAWSLRAHGTPLWQPGVVRTLAAAAVTGLTWWSAAQALPPSWLDHAWELIVAGIAGLVMYVGLLAALREVTAEDARIVARVVHPRTWLPRKGGDV